VTHPSAIWTGNERAAGVRLLRSVSGMLRPQEEILLEPFNYYGKLPGKGIRPRMIAAFNQWLHVSGPCPLLPLNSLSAPAPAFPACLSLKIGKEGVFIQRRRGGGVSRCCAAALRRLRSISGSV